MRHSISPLAVVTLPVFVLTALVLLAILLAEKGLESPLPAPSEMAQEVNRGRSLDQRLMVVQATQAERAQILTNVLEGYISLDSALEFLRPLNENEPICWHMLREHFPNSSDEEILGYQLAVCASNCAIEHSPTATKRVLMRQLRARFGKRALIPQRL